MLQLARDLDLPLRVVTEKLAWLGRTGSGKTYGAIKLAELMLDAGAQVGAIDPVGVWPALRIPAKKGGRSFEVVVFGGLRGDLPLEPTAGELIADLVCDRGFSFVIDVSQFIPSEQQRFVRAFADRFFQRKKAKPGAVHLFMEECQEFIPENPSHEEAKTLGAMQRLWKIGRNFGIGGSLISQRPQEVAKKALNMSGTLFAFQMTAPQERKAVKAWVADHGVAVDIEAVLQKLETGQPHVESPMFLAVSKTVRILARETADLSSTPEVGVATAAARPLTPIDIENLKTSMAATIEKAKGEDPRELQRTVKELRAQVEKLQGATPSTSKEGAGDRRKDAARIRALIKALEAAVRFIVQISAEDFFKAGADKVDPVEIQKALEAAMRGVTKTIDDKLTARNQQVDRLRREAERIAAGLKRVLADEEVTVEVSVRHQEPFAVTPAAARPVRQASAPRTNGEISGVEQRILDALAELEVLGVSRPDRVQVAFMSGYTNLTSKGFVNASSALRSAGLIDYPTSGTTMLTENGAKLANFPEAPRSSKEIQSRVIAMLGGAAAKVLEPLIKAYPEAMDRTDVAAAAGYTNLTSKGFVNVMSRLRSLGFVDYPTTGTAIAKPVLFIGKD